MKLQDYFRFFQYPVLHALDCVLHVLNRVLHEFYSVLHVLNSVLHEFYWLLHKIRVLVVSC